MARSRINWWKWGCIIAVLALILGVVQYSKSSAISQEDNKNIIQVEIEDKSPELWLGVVWGNEFKRTVSIKNISQEGKPLVSDLRQFTGVDTPSFLKVSCTKGGKEVVLGERRSFTRPVLKDTTLPFEINENLDPCDTEWFVSVQVECDDSDIRKCYEEQLPFKFSYKKENVNILQIIGIDATYWNNPNYTQDDIELSAFRSDITAELGIKETAQVYKTIPAKPFPVYHKKDNSVSWNGIILLYHPTKHSEQSFMTEKMKFMLQKRYPYASIIVKPYTEGNFNFYTQAFEDIDCSPKDGRNECPGGQFDFPSLKSGLPGDENRYTAKVYHQNPNLDFMFMLPYNNQK